MSKPARPQPSPKSLEKTANQPPARQTPRAPAVYRPQPTPQVLQRKAAVSPPGMTTKRPPAAPPVYRPGLAPAGLQAKKAVAGPGLTGQPARPPAGPPPTSHNRRAEAVQLKGTASPTPSTAPPPPRPAAAPVHKPQPTLEAPRGTGRPAAAPPGSRPPRTLLRPPSTATIQRMTQPRADVILVGETHNKAAAKEYVISKLSAWASDGYDKLGVELGRDEPVGEEFTGNPGDTLQDALDAAATNAAVRKSIKEQIYLMTSSGEQSLGRMISKAVKAGFHVYALETAASSKVKLKDREKVMDPIAVGRISSLGTGWVAVVGRSHLAGINSLLTLAGLTVEVVDKS